MSKCISQHGEFSEHTLDVDHFCTRCLVLDEDPLIDELRQARESVASLTAENERLRTDLADLEAGKGELYDDLLRADAAIRAYRSRAEVAERALSSLRELESAARTWRERLGSSREVMVFGSVVGAQSRALVAAVDALSLETPLTSKVADDITTTGKGHVDV